MHLPPFIKEKDQDDSVDHELLGLFPTIPTCQSMLRKRCEKAHLLQDERLAQLSGDLGVRCQPVVDEAVVRVLPVVGPHVDGGKVNVLAHLHADKNIDRAFGVSFAQDMPGAMGLEKAGCTQHLGCEMDHAVMQERECRCILSAAS